MPNVQRIGVALAIVLCCTGTSAWSEHGSTCRWKTVDDFIPPTQTGAAASGVWVTATDAWVIGQASSNPATSHWLVRKQLSAHAAWSTVDDFAYSLTLRNHPEAITQGSNGALYVVGGANNLSNDGAWLVRRSTDRGATWTLTDEFSDPAEPASSAQSVATTATGEVIVGGFHNIRPDGYHWVVRGNANQGATFGTREDVAPILYSAGVEALATDTGGTVWSAGYNYEPSRWRWQVRRGTANGGSVLVDDYVLGSDATSIPAAVVTPRPGEVYVAGYGTDSLGRTHWIVRGTTNNGATWQTLDDHSPWNNCSARSIAFDSRTGALFVAGRCFDGVQYRWTVRVSRDRGRHWATEDSFVLSDGATTYANGIHAGPNGRVLAVGLGNDGARNHWLVRERRCDVGDAERDDDERDDDHDSHDGHSRGDGSHDDHRDATGSRCGH